MRIQAALIVVLFASSLQAQDLDVHDYVEHRFVENEGVDLHYVRLGDGPLVVLIHGFPDYWYTWRNQMAVLAETHTVVAMDQRGYNRSDSPDGTEHYAMRHLVSDVAAVVRDNGFERATIVGHDWGAAVAWQVAMNLPDLVERLVVLSVPHPAGFGRELSSNAKQIEDSQYARDFQAPDSHESLTAQGLAGWVSDPLARTRYVAAFERSDFAAMMDYYRANYPGAKGGGTIARPASTAGYPRVQCSVLVLHGMRDTALHAAGHAGTWDHVDGTTTIVMLPSAGHFLQIDAADEVTRELASWLERTPPAGE